MQDLKIKFPHKKVVEAKKHWHNGKYVWLIGEREDIGEGETMFFEDWCSGAVLSFDENGNQTPGTKNKTVRTEEHGEFYDTEAEAIAAGKAQLKEYEAEGFWPLADPWIKYPVGERDEYWTR